MKLDLMKKALKTLDEKLYQKHHTGVQLLIGGGSALSLAYHVPLQTADIDGILFKSSLRPSELDIFVKQTARELGISAHWLNSYFGTFLMSLPADYGDRLVSVFKGKSLEAHALGLEDLLIMKCFAGREKDIPHARILLRKGAKIDFVERHLESLVAKNIPSAKDALDFLLEVEDQMGE